jgi:hypothetical protein
MPAQKPSHSLSLNFALKSAISILMFVGIFTAGVAHAQESDSETGLFKEGCEFLSTPREALVKKNLYRLFFRKKGFDEWVTPIFTESRDFPAVREKMNAFIKSDQTLLKYSLEGEEFRRRVENFFKIRQQGQSFEHQVDVWKKTEDDFNRFRKNLPSIQDVPYKDYQIEILARNDVSNRFRVQAGFDPTELRNQRDLNAQDILDYYEKRKQRYSFQENSQIVKGEGVNEKKFKLWLELEKSELKRMIAENLYQAMAEVSRFDRLGLLTHLICNGNKCGRLTLKLNGGVGHRDIVGQEIGRELELEARNIPWNYVPGNREDRWKRAFAYYSLHQKDKVPRGSLSIFHEDYLVFSFDRSEVKRHSSEFKQVEGDLFEVAYPVESIWSLLENYLREVSFTTLKETTYLKGMLRLTMDYASELERIYLFLEESTKNGSQKSFERSLSDKRNELKQISASTPASLYFRYLSDFKNEALDALNGIEWSALLD